MKRFLALLAAVALIGGALLVRSRLIEGPSVAGPEPAGTETTSRSGRLRVRCAAELSAVCAEVEKQAGATVSSTSVADTADALIAGNATDFDLWVAPAAWVDVVEVTSPDMLGEPVPLARSELVVAGKATATLNALKASPACGGTLTWTCMTSLAGQDWSSLPSSGLNGRIRIAPSSRKVEGFGLASLGLAAADLDELRAAATRQRGELEVLGPTEDPFTALVNRGAVNVTGVVGLRARDTSAVVVPTVPVAYADVYVVAVGSRKIDNKVVDVAKERLLRDGWAARSSSDPASGLPDARRLAEARNLWEEVLT